MRTLLFLLVACNSGSSGSTAAGGAAGGAAAAGPAPATATLPATANAPAVAASWEGGSIPYADLQKDISLQIARMEADYLTKRYEAESQALDEQINTALLETEAKKQGLANADALLQKEVKAKISEPTDAEINEAYEVMKRRLGGQPLEAVKDRMVAAVKQKKEAERFQVYMDELRTSYKVSVQLPYPNLPRIPVSVDDDPGMGPETAPVTIVQFAEYQCPYCGRAQETMDEVLKAYGDKVRFVYRDFPLSFHDRAIPAAIAANCAGQQGKYWEVHRTFMANQRALQEADLQKAAADAGVDLAKWEECRKDPNIEAEIKKDMADGEAAGVTGTPAFFVNGLFISGAQPFEKFQSLIDRELGKG